MNREELQDRREELISEGVTVPEIPQSFRQVQEDRMSTFSCRTGRYCSTAGDVIVFKVDPDNDDDDATIKTEVESTISQSGFTIKSEKTQFSTPISQMPPPTEKSFSHRSRRPLSTFNETLSNPSTVSTTEAPRAASTVPVNENYDDDNYNILLRRKDDKPVHSLPNQSVQTGMFPFLKSYDYFKPF